MILYEYYISQYYLNRLTVQNNKTMTQPSIKVIFREDYPNNILFQKILLNGKF